MIKNILHWRKSLSPDDAKELERLRSDGHQIVHQRRHYEIHSDLEAVRSTQLYRTLPHEVGHYVDYLNSTDDQGSCDLFWQKNSKDKEDFAHRYADEFFNRQQAAGQVPFSRKLDKERLVADGLSPEWFS